MIDPFDTESLRESILAAWGSSPTRLREDSASESDLVRGGYRDRLLTELAQNAADAAQRAGVPGRLAVWTDEFGALHVANTGAALDVSGVHALTALRASAKGSTDPGVGQFGVGFTAVRSVSDEIELRSRGGGVAFSARRTFEALRERGMLTPDTGVPVLRLAWPVADSPADGFDTEIVLTLRADVAADSFASGLADEAVDLLLELEALDSIEIDGVVIDCSRIELDDHSSEITIGPRTWRQFATPAARWLAPVVDGLPVPAPPDVLRAPTRSDELLSLPALVIADVPMQPDRRRVLPGVSFDAVAHGYVDFVASLPAASRVSFVPEVGFARSEVDGALRELVFRRLSCAPWLPGVDGRDLVPERANVVADATEELTEVLTGVVPDLVDASLSGARHASALAAVGVHRIGLARLAEMVGGLDREPSWWRRLFDALTPLVVDGVAAEELAALPVPLADGRTVTGPRTTVIGSDASAAVTWVRLVHPEAVSPLLSRLGAREATATELLTDPALEAALDDLDWDESEEVDGLVSAVLALAGEAGELPGWLGGLPLEDDEGELRSADELLLPGAPLADLLIQDSPFGVLAPAVVARFGERALRAVGVGWGFSVVRDELPTGPDHDLDDESAWWSGLSEEPESLLAVRDLDLVRSDGWSEALTVLLDDPSTRAALADRDGYTAWWIGRHARVHGSRPVNFRAPSDETFAGLLDPLNHPRADELQAVLSASICESADTARVLLAALSDPQRSPTPAVIARTHTLIATAVVERRFEVSDIDPPDRVRTLGGAVVDASDALVIDAPWLVSVVPPEVAVLSDMATAAALADVLDIRSASEAISGEVLGVGRVSSWDREPGAVLACAVMGLPLPSGGVVVHRELVVRLSGDVSGERTLPWWVTADGTVHCTESWERPRGV
ncbi:ATP-binding protein [Rhodococcus sp. IEGM 1401]|uniref:sacsin N-terminal ATP-binding-like domain-containing protein n=1 Tax=unclassified Rhodococcus (in: high G+C Gram-positive bacteria) TaxID=192944 RepID=UPI0022B4D8E5|nr:MULTISPECIES: ATP-binding protein [unclassified Rhodococcus (in: high G+C Gram-positive bacteria)]MCZ4561242.1 ATP-binding protein [Rhodococcus sp. IEGM 1401]MDI9921385.1 ATP-binding protein [Rhodococcus sp. IEGM 1372]MDV8033828.1 ATP-binding protein [Rhodococcus sp. IEGM 1414]MDV8074997.1 ATP-binding protein [Rhodococcus sp. IEGM 1370]